MAPVVYQGVAGGGDLFQGQKFFIMQRIPGRLQLIEDIQRNGGFVVPLEKNADVLIADHAKPKLAPSNSVSWKYLEQSLKKGQLEDLETHRIGPPSGTPRPVGSGQPRKLTRTPFTHKDDMELLKWVTKAQMRGLSIKGNDIYEQLEAINPRHTSQSWRDRWVKYVCHQPQPEIDIGDTSGPVQRSGEKSHIKAARADIPPHTISLPTTAPNISSTTKRSALLKPQLPVPPVPSEDGLPFTEEDVEILETEYHDIVRLDLAQLVSAWQTFATAHGRHTADEWCKYYHNVFKPRKDQESVRKDARKGEEKAKHNRTSVSTAETRTTPIRAASSSRSSTVTKVSRFGQKQVDGFNSSPSLKSRSIKEPSRISVSDAKAKFLENLRDLASIMRRKIEPCFSIDGDELQLYDLWNVVNKPEFGGVDKIDKTNRWLQVAVKLGINTYKHAMAHTTLRQLYHSTLIDFDTFCELRKDSRTDGSSTPTSSAKQVTAATVITSQTSKPTQILSCDENSPKMSRPAAIPHQKPAHEDVAAERIRLSLGHGELAFLQSLEEFAQDVLKQSIDLEPTVSERKISLYSLWTASLPLLDKFDYIESKEVWVDVANKLGFDLFEHPSAPKELWQICDNLLADYYEFFKIREVEKAKEQALRQQSNNQEQSEDEVIDDFDDDLERPSSALVTPRHNSRKRSHVQDSISSVVESTLHNKRPRTSKGKERAMEIPSTPEHIYNNHLNSEAELSDHQEAKSIELIDTRRTRFSPPVLSEELDSSPSRQLWSEARTDHTIPSQPNIEEETTHSQTDSQVANRDIGEFIERFKEAGFDEEVILKMLRITNMEVELTEGLLAEHADGLEVPGDIAGVWTEEDDYGVKSSRQSAEYKRTLRKHGQHRCLLRKNFLEDWEEGQAKLASGT